MEVTTDRGCSDTLRRTVEIYDRPIAFLDAPSLVACGGTTIRANVVGGDTTDYTFQVFRDNIAIPGATSASYYANEDGCYKYIVSTKGSEVCTTTTDEACITINDSPIAGFDTPVQVCADEIFSLSNTSSVNGNQNSPMNYLWVLDGNGTATTRDILDLSYATPGNYDLTLYVTNPVGECTDTLTKAITVNPIPSVSIEPQSNIPFCPNTGADMVLKAIIQGTGMISLQWEKDGQPILGAIREFLTITEEGNYTVRMINHSLSPCEVMSEPIVFTFSSLPNFDLIKPEQICVNNQAHFSVEYLDTDLTMVGFFFQDGGQYVQPNISHTFSTSGFHEVMLVMENTFGCRDTVTAEVFVSDNPTANFSTLLDICLGKIADFVSTSQNGSRFEWDFGDGNVSNLENPKYFYESPGTYDAKLVVTNNNGCKDSTTQEIIVRPVPSANFSVAPDCDNLTYQFTDQTVSSAFIETYHWDFGDGQTSNEENPLHSFSESGLFKIVLTVTSIDGCDSQKDTTLFFESVMGIAYSYTPPCVGKEFTLKDESFSVDSLVGRIVRWQWKVGDSLFSTEQNPTFIIGGNGVIPLEFTITTEDGCTRTITDVLTINKNPIAGFSMSPSLPFPCPDKLPVIVNLTNTSSSDAITYEWTMPDMSKIPVENPNYTVASVGLHPFTLKVTNDSLCVDTIKQVFEVYDSIKVSYDVTDISNIGCGDQTYYFNSSTNPIATYFNWFVGNQLVGNEKDLEYTFERLDSIDNNFTVRLEASSPDASCTYSYSSNITIPAVVMADFEFSQQFVIINLSDTVYTGLVNFQNTSLNGQEFSWTFEDISTNPITPSDKQPSPSNSIEENPQSIRFDSPIREYRVTLYATDEFGCSDTTSQILKLNYFDRITLADVFTPDNDVLNLNDIYEVWNDSEVKSFLFEVRTLNGEIIVSNSTNFQTLWDGTMNNSGVNKAIEGWYNVSLRVTFWDEETRIYNSRIHLGRLKN